MDIAPITAPAVNGASAPVPLRLGAGAASAAFAALLEDELLQGAPAPMPPPPPIPASVTVVTVPGLVAGYAPVWTAREGDAKRPPDQKRRPPKRQ